MMTNNRRQMMKLTSQSEFSYLMFNVVEILGLGHELLTLQLPGMYHVDSSLNTGQGNKSTTSLVLRLCLRRSS